MVLIELRANARKARSKLFRIQFVFCVVVAPTGVEREDIQAETGGDRKNLSHVPLIIVLEERLPGISEPWRAEAASFLLQHFRSVSGNYPMRIVEPVVLDEKRNAASGGREGFAWIEFSFEGEYVGVIAHRNAFPPTSQVGTLGPAWSFV